VNWLCYILRCADDTLYCGITNDLDKRLAAHNAGTASKYTRTRLPVELVFAAPCADRSAASKREMEIKSLKRAEKLVLIQLRHLTDLVFRRRSGFDPERSLSLSTSNGRFSAFPDTGDFLKRRLVYPVWMSAYKISNR